MSQSDTAAGLSHADLELIELARGAIRRRHKPGWHVIGAALRTRSGGVFTGVHLEATVGRIAVCAEAIALGRAATEAGDTDIDTIVAVRHSGSTHRAPEITVLAPCGMCREMIPDYGPSAMVIVPRPDGNVAKKPIRKLLPDKYKRN